jgi:hypothetical protein
MAVVTCVHGIQMIVRRDAASFIVSGHDASPGWHKRALRAIVANQSRIRVFLDRVAEADGTVRHHPSFR